jgi:hypothetical protein
MSINAKKMLEHYFLKCCLAISQNLIHESSKIKLGKAKKWRKLVVRVKKYSAPVI